VKAHTMNRRRALKTLSLGGIGAAAVPAWVDRLSDVAFALSDRAAPRSASTAQWTPALLTPHQNETVITLSELIIPQTETAGAKAANVNEFIDTVLADAQRAEREQFLRGLEWVDTRSHGLFGAPFTLAAPQQQTTLLTIISSATNRTPADQVGVEFFRALKTLTITGYYTSKVGMLEELGDDGRLVFSDYIGCVHPEHKGAAPAIRQTAPGSSRGARAEPVDADRGQREAAGDR